MNCICLDGLGGEISGVWIWFRTYAGGPLLVGLVVAYILPRANQRIQGRREQLAKNLDLIRSQLGVLRQKTATYWLSDAGHGQTSELEADIEYLLADLAGLVNACKPYLWKDASSHGPTLMSQLALASVGSTFGTPTRSADPGRLNLIATAAAELTTEVTAKRKDFFH